MIRFALMAKLTRWAVAGDVKKRFQRFMIRSALMAELTRWAVAGDVKKRFQRFFSGGEKT
ncbi:hypothetical protein [Dickeya dadantii]|nr:hypothetical protein [Dickeya dadantii]